MAETFGFSAKVGADVSGFQKGMQKAEKSLKKFADGITNIGKKGIVGSLANVSLAIGGVTTAFKTATKVVRDVAKAVGECTEAYKQQAIVERTLQTAIQNNPYVTGDALSNLKQFASDMQRISNYGDEQIMQLETQLISLGRTEEETMNIIKVAMDMSATGTMTLDTAITQLNATLNGNIGRLGQQNAELKGLTEEELKSGKAVEILGEKFKGLSQATVDTSTQLKNIKGDFKEAIGEFTLPTSDMWNKFWAGFYEKGIAILNQFNDYLDRVIVGEVMSEKIIDNVKSIKDEREKILYIEDEVHTMTEKQLNILLNYYKNQKHLSNNEEKVYDILQREVKAREYLSKFYAEMDAEEADRLKAEEEQRKEDEKIAKLKEEYLEKIAEQEAKWQHIKEVTGEEVKNEEKIKFYQDSLVDLMTQAGGQITTNNQLYKDQMAIIEKLAKEIVPETETKLADISAWEDKLLSQEIERLQTMKEMELEQGNGAKYEIETRYGKLILDLQMQQLEKEKELALAKIEGTENAEEARLKILRYYEEEERLLRVSSYVKGNNDIKKETQKTWKEIASTITKTMSTVFNKISSLMKQVFSTIRGAGKKLFDFNTDDALVSLLKFEDKVLSFFVETVPKLPAFFESAMQSISVLLQSILSSGGLEMIGGVITSFMKSIKTYMPSIITTLGSIIHTILDSIDFGEIVEWLLNGLISILPKLIQVLTKVVKKFIQMLPKVLPLIIKGVTTLIVEVVKALPTILQTLIPELLRAVIETIKSLLTHLPEIIKVLIEAIPQIIRAVIQGLIDFISNLSAKDLADIIVGIIKMTADVALTIIKNIGKLVAELIPALIQLIWELIKSIPQILGGILEGAWEGLQWVGEKVWDGVQSAGKAIASGAEAVWDGIKSALGKLKFWASGTNNAPKGLAVVGEAGPELVRFNGGEQVLNTRNTQKALANMGSNSGNQFNVTFNNTIDTTAYALMQQLKQYNRQLSINGVI